MARFFSESFERRTNAPLRIVTGDPRTAALVALGAPSRPSLFLSATPERSPWVTPAAIRTNGAIVVWPTTDTAGTPPAEIREQFPDLVPEVPRAFERAVQGRLPLLRIGWAVIRPQGQAAPSASAGRPHGGLRGRAATGRPARRARSATALPSRTWPRSTE